MHVFMHHLCKLNKSNSLKDLFLQFVSSNIFSEILKSMNEKSQCELCDKYITTWIFPCQLFKLYSNILKCANLIEIRLCMSLCTIFLIPWHAIFETSAQIQEVYFRLNRNIHSNVNVLGRFYKHFLTSLYGSTLFDIVLKPVSKQKYLQVEQNNSLKDILKCANLIEIRLCMSLCTIFLIPWHAIFETSAQIQEVYFRVMKNSSSLNMVICNIILQQSNTF
jgi:DNA-binding XRE family transcriptional regulator